MHNTKNEISHTWPTIFDLASTIPEIDIMSVRPRGKKNAQPVTHGLHPEPFPVREGFFEVTPEQIASLRVPKIEVSDEVKGFQREKVNSHVRKIARALLEGAEMPPLMVSIFPDGNAYVDDGQHRALGAIVARLPLEVVVKHRTVDQARKLFTGQAKARSLRSDDTLLTGDSPIELYIQDALTSQSHPWQSIVGEKATRYRISPTSMAAVVGAFVFNSLAVSINDFRRRPENEFDEAMADRLADLVTAFGTKHTNPVAFRGGALRAIAFSSVYIFRRNPANRPQDWERWKTHMTQFDFGKHPHLVNREAQLALAMVDHWNKRLPEIRRVKPFAFTNG